MRIKNYLALVAVCSLFITAQAAVDATKKVQFDSDMQVTLKKIPKSVYNNRAQVQDKLQIEVTEEYQLKERVQQQLRSSIKNYDPSRFKISNQNNVIIIEGTVRNNAEAEQLEKVALQVKGVKQVLKIVEIE